MPVEIHEVRGRRDLRTFVEFPFSLYEKSPYWIPPLIKAEIDSLRPEVNPAFEHCELRCWLAKRDGRVVGRIAAIHHRAFVQRWALRHARFGWVDFIDDEEVSGALFEAAESWAREKGMTAIHGPLGFTDMDPEGMLVEGFEELGTMATIYNFPYYPVHLERRGYEKETDWVEYEIRTPDDIPERAVKVARRVVERRGFRVLEATSSKEILPYAPGVFQVINETYAGLHGFVPLTDRQIRYYVELYFPNVSPDFIKIILDTQDQVAGFVIAIPSLSRALQKARGRLFPFGFLHLLRAMRRPRTIDLLLGAIRTDLQGTGADALLMTTLNQSCLRRGIVSAESSPELESNKLVQAHWKNFEHRQHKRRRCFIKQL